MNDIKGVTRMLLSQNNFDAFLLVNNNGSMKFLIYSRAALIAAMILLIKTQSVNFSKYVMTHKLVICYSNEFAFKRFKFVSH